MKYIKSALSIITAAWLLLCFVYSGYLFYKRQAPMYSRNYEISSYGYPDRQAKEDRVALDLSKFVDGDFFGKITLTISTSETKHSIKKGEAAFVTYPTLNHGLYPDWIEVKQVAVKYGNIILESENNVQIIDQKYANKYFPFDKYHVWFRPELKIVDKAGNIIFEKIIKLADFKATFPQSLLMTRTNINPVYGKSEAHEFLYVMERPLWFKWFLGGVLGFLMIPILITLHSGGDTISIDIIAFVISVVSIRSFLIEGGRNIIIFDYVLGAIVLIFAIIILIKLQYREKIKNT